MSEEEFFKEIVSRPLFVIALIPLSITLNKSKEGYLLGAQRGKVNQLLFMDDLKLYAKDIRQLDSLVQTVRIFSNDIGMEFGIQKCAMLELKRGKMIQSNGLDLPEEQKLTSLEDGEGNRYLGILESVEMKDILRKEYYHRVKKILRSSLNAGNKIQAINSRAVSLMRYGAGIIEWTKEDTRQMDRKTRKLFTMYRSMHPQSDVDRLYWKRTEGGRGLQSIEVVVEIEKASMGFYLHQAEEFMLKKIAQEGFFRDSTDPVDKKRELVDKHKLQFEEKKQHFVFFRETKGVRDEKDTWLWLKKGVLKRKLRD